jgi:hypothetical protein
MALQARPSRRLDLLLVAIATCGCRPQPSPTVFVDPALATLVPSGTMFIVGVRVQQLEPTPLYQRYFLPGKLPLVEKFARETGLDLQKEIWEVVVPYDGKTYWVMLRGKFAEMGMEPRINKEGAKRLGYKGYTILGDESMATLFLNPTTAIAGPLSALQSIIDSRDKAAGIPKWLDQRIRTIPSTNQAWFVGDLAAVTQIARPLGLVTGGLDLHSGLNAEITLSGTSADDAAIKKIFSSERLQILERRIRIHKELSGAKIRIEIPADQLNEVVGLLGANAWGPESRRPD